MLDENKQPVLIDIGEGGYVQEAHFMLNNGRTGLGVALLAKGTDEVVGMHS